MSASELRAREERQKKGPTFAASTVFCRQIRSGRLVVGLEDVSLASEKELPLPLPLLLLLLMLMPMPV